jgi:hypothetical protein
VGNVLEVVNGWEVKGQDIGTVKKFIDMAIKKVILLSPSLFPPFLYLKQL